MLESKFKADTLTAIRDMLPGCIIIHGNANSVQGIPDTLILYFNQWAGLEFKKTEKSIHQPNQDIYVDMFNDWSFAAFIFPDNQREVLEQLSKFMTFRPRS